MGVEVPHEVAAFLNFMGVPYPDIDEDQVRELARQVRTYADNVASTHESATGAVRDMGSVYSGYSYEQLLAAWGRRSAGNMQELDHACRVVARALDIAAEVITAVKIAVLTALAALAASFASLMVVTAATGGLSAAWTLAVRTAAQRIVSAMEDMVIGYIAAEVIGKAIEPLEDAVERMINRTVYNKAAEELGGPPSSSPQELRIDLDEVMRYADLLDKYADDMLDHSRRFAENIAVLNFTRSDGIGEPTPTDQGAPTAPLPGAPGHDSSPQRQAAPPGAAPPASPAPQVPTDAVAAPHRSEVDRPSATTPTQDAPEKSDRAAAPSENSSAAAQSADRTGAGGPAADRAAAAPASMTADGAAPMGGSVSERGMPAGQHAPSVSAPVGSENVVQQDNPASNAPMTTSAAHASALSSETNSQSPGQQQGAPRGQGGPQAQTAAQPSRGSSQASTPWQRAGQGTPKSERRGPARRVVAPAAEHKTGATPWSKGARPAAEETTAAEPKVFAPEPAERKRDTTKTTGPKVVAPETGVPKVVAPKTTGPEPAAPETGERETVAPKNVEPEGVPVEGEASEARPRESAEPEQRSGTPEQSARPTRPVR
ncbi:WXG100-like domain-containing protein [Nocardia thraciensis]